MPPNFTRAAECFLKSSGAAELDLKVESYLKYAECVHSTNPGKALYYYEQVLKIQDRDEASRGLMHLYYHNSLDAEDDMDELLDALTKAKAKENGQRISMKKKDDRSILKDVNERLSKLTLSTTVTDIPEELPVMTHVMDSINVTDFKDDTAKSDVSIDVPNNNTMSDAKVTTSSNNTNLLNELDKLLIDAKRGVKKARLSLEKQAQEGDLNAAKAVIQLYEEGVVVKRDERLIFDYKRFAAEAGDQEYQYYVAKAYQEGVGIAKNMEEALRFYTFAARNGHMPSHFELATLLIEGDGVKKNPQEALQYYENAASNGYMPAIVALANLYATHQYGLKADAARAIQLYPLSMSSNDTSGDVYYQFGNAYEMGVHTLKRSEENAHLMYLKGAEKNHHPSIQLALCYMNGYGGLNPEDRSALPFYKAAALGNEDVIKTLAMLYMNQKMGLSQESNDAILIYKQAGDLGHVPSLIQLGNLYKNGYKDGKGVQQSNIDAKVWYQKAAAAGSQEARILLQSGCLDVPLAPSFARGFENVYNRFINGKLVFDNGQGQTKTFKFSQFKDTLNGEFDLSGLTVDGNAINQYLRIKLGIRQVQENDSKVTVWFTPKFMVDQSNSEWRNQTWSSDVGIFWSYGNWDLKSFDYLTSKKFDEISNQNLLKVYGAGRGAAVVEYGVVWWWEKFFPAF